MLFLLSVLAHGDEDHSMNQISDVNAEIPQPAINTTGSMANSQENGQSTVGGTGEQPHDHATMSSTGEQPHDHATMSSTGEHQHDHTTMSGTGQQPHQHAHSSMDPDATSEENGNENQNSEGDEEKVFSGSVRVFFFE